MKIRRGGISGSAAIFLRSVDRRAALCLRAGLCITRLALLGTLSIAVSDRAGFLLDSEELTDACALSLFFSIAGGAIIDLIAKSKKHR